MSKHCREAVLASMKQLLDLLTIIGSGYLELSQYKLKRSLKYFQKLNSDQFNTGKVLSMVALANFEMANYKEVSKKKKKERKNNTIIIKIESIYIYIYINKYWFSFNNN